MHRRNFLFGAGAATIIPGAACGQSRVGTFRPEEFGAKGDGRTDDTAAFAALSAALARAGGGTVALRPTTYRVGAQRAAADGDWAYRPEPVMQALNLPGPFRLEGNGARLVARTGLKYGTFERRTGEALRRAMPNFRRGEWASPYRAMVHVAGVRGGVEITGLELDGALPQQLIGGPWGDLGHQIPAFGLLIENNGNGELIADVRSRRHGQDGMLIAARTDRRARTRLERVVCAENGRQGASLVAGRGFDLVDCDFRRTGRGPIASAPGAGVDIEAERNQPIRDLRFTRCRFEDNHGVGMVADSGDTEGAVFTECRFVGATNPSAWPSKPRFRFERCTFVGGLLRAHGDLQRPELATRFTECRFLDDPRLSPTGKVYGPLSADLGETANPLFERCRFELTHANLLPWSVNAVYRDCEMSQRAGGQAFPRGRYQGRNVIRGNAELGNSRIEGEVVLNGRRLPRS